MLAKFLTKAIDIQFCWRDDSSFRCYTLGPLCLWQYFDSTWWENLQLCNQPLSLFFCNALWMQIDVLGYEPKYSLSDLSLLRASDTRARWFLWNVSASSHMTSVTQRNILAPMGVVGNCSYTPHNNHLNGWILLQCKNMYLFILYFYIVRKIQPIRWLLCGV